MGGSPLVGGDEFPCTLGPSCGGVWAPSLSSPSGEMTRLPLPSGTLHRHTSTGREGVTSGSISTLGGMRRNCLKTCKSTTRR